MASRRELAVELLQRRGDLVAGPLEGAADADEAGAEGLVAEARAGVEVAQREPGGERHPLEPAGRQDLPLDDGDLAGVDVDRAGLQALVADGAVVGHLLEVAEQLEGPGALALGVVEERLDEGADGQVLVARVEEHPAGRVEDAAIRLALPAAHAGGDAPGQLLELAVLEDAGLQLQEVERRRVDLFQGRQVGELARVHEAARVDHPPVGLELLAPLRVPVLQLGDADAVLAGDHPAELVDPVEDLLHHRVGAPEHLPVVGEHRDVHVHVAVAGVHVGGEDDEAGAHLVPDAPQRGGHLGVAAEQRGQVLPEPVGHGEGTDLRLGGLLDGLPRLHAGGERRLELRRPEVVLRCRAGRAGRSRRAGRSSPGSVAPRGRSSRRGRARTRPAR